MRALLLVRHGETLWNAEQRLQGQQDLPLSDVGARQARALRSIVESLLTDGASRRLTVVSSPLTRARETCELLGFTPDVIDDRWQEADLGTWTGQTRAQLEASGTGEYAEWRSGDFTPPEAEDLALLRARVSDAIDHLCATTDVALVVTHGGPIRASCRALVDLDQGHLVPVEPGSLTLFDTQGAVPRLRYYNLTPRTGPLLLREAPD